jgi:hypothetical protein
VQIAGSGNRALYIINGDDKHPGFIDTCGS